MPYGFSRSFQCSSIASSYRDKLDFMPALATRTYENITPEKWKAIQSAAELYGFNLEQNQGEAQSYGADVRWNLRADTQVLTVEVWRSLLLSLDQVVSILGRMIDNA